MTPERFEAILAAVRKHVRLSPFSVAARVLDQTERCAAGALTREQQRLVVRTAWRYRRQMPPELVPTEIEKAEATWTPKPVYPRRRRRIVVARTPELPLFGG